MFNRRQVLNTVVGLVILQIVGFVIAGQIGTREVRIDSGDRRIRWLWWSVPEPPVPGRDHLVKLSKEIGIPAEWHRPPFTAPTYVDQDRFRQFSGAAWWAEHEPPFAAIILKGLARYYQNPPAESGLPSVTSFIGYLEWKPDGSGLVLSDFWTESLTPEELQWQLDEVRYVPVPGGVVDGLLLRAKERAAKKANPENP